VLCSGCAQRNYRFFLAFVFTTSVLDLWVHAWAWVRLVYICRHAHVDLGTAIVQEPAAIALIGYTFLALGCAGHPLPPCAWSFHDVS
jgi:hypothetical protein